MVDGGTAGREKKQRPATSWVTALLKWVLAGSGCLYVLSYLFVACSRIRYPFELEWVEGAMVDHVSRILAGEKLYVGPSLAFVPVLYTPLFFHVAAAVTKVTGVGFLPLRLVSFVASLGSFVVLFLIVYRETRSKLAGLLTACLFAATYVLSGAWLDIGRVDSLFLLLVLAVVYVVRFKATPGGYALAGVLLLLAYLTKQSSLAICLPIMLYAALWQRRLAPFFIGTALVLIGLGDFGLDRIHHGWYHYYLYHLPSHKEVFRERYLSFWRNEILLPLPIACLGALWYLVTAFRCNKQAFGFYALMSAGMMGVSYAVRIRQGGYLNSLLPSYLAIAILFGLGFHAAVQSLVQRPAGGTRPMIIMAYLFGILQFGLLHYDPMAQIPTAADVRAGNDFLRIVRSLPGDVFIQSHGYLSVLAGKQSHAQGVAMGDVLRNDTGEIGLRLENELHRAIAEQRFGAIVYDNGRPPTPDVYRYYRLKQVAFSDQTVFWPRTGVKARPELILVPISK